jgi:alkylation response protein AidB-like acyl-CoA dehydrogenase
MQLHLSDEDAEFREEMRAFFTTQVSEDIRTAVADRRELTKDQIVESQRTLNAAGLAVPHWPEEWGGRGWSALRRHIWHEEMQRACVPAPLAFNTSMVGPVIATFGSQQQKERFLPPTANLDIWWSQGFSEPDAGSDLASLRTSAVRDGDDYVVNGQKIWCSFAHIADYGELLVRTDPDAPKHRGISWLILPMDTPGIDVRPIDTVLGSSEFCEVFLDDVRVPVANRVGAENDGWRITQVTFAFERGTAFVSELVEARRMAEDLAGLARDPAHRHELGHVVAELDGVWALTKRNVTRAARDGSPGDGALMVKLAYSESRQKLGDLSVRVLDRSALDIDNEFVVERLRTLALTIAAGTSQIQRNIISERLLGLPREQQWTSS